MHFEHIGETAALGTAICWTVTALAFESAGRRVGSLAVNLIRLVFAFVFLTAFCTLSRGHSIPSDATAHAWIWLGLSGVTGFTIGDLCLFRAFVVMGSRLSMLLMALVPSFTAIISWLILGERLSPMDWLGMALTTGGVAWVVMERKTNDAGKISSLPRSGVLLGVGGALGQAVGLTLSKYGMADYDPFQATQIRVMAGALGFAVLFLFIGWWPRVFSALKNRAAMERTVLGGVFGPFLGVSLSLVAIQHTEAGVAATIMALVPVLIIPPSVLIKKERVSHRAIFGASIAVGGVAILFL
jgi:drug/metabolite transporter (DMT)-like permease